MLLYHLVQGAADYVTLSVDLLMDIKVCYWLCIFNYECVNGSDSTQAGSLKTPQLLLRQDDLSILDKKYFYFL